MRRISIHPAVVLAVAAIGMLAASIGGPDFGRYRQWAFALRNADIFAIPSNIGSPLGLPVTQWSHGPGMLFTVPLVTLGRVVNFTDAPFVAGWASILVFWWAFFRILTWAARGNLALTAFGAGAAFLGTHAGFYTRAHASESLALVALALLVAAVVDPDPRLIRGSWMIGCAAALLFATRTYYIVYAAPALALSADRIITSGRLFAGPAADTGMAAAGTSGRRRLVAATALAIPLLIAIAQQLLVNRWMTGSVRRSVYVFGDATYRSMDWLAPQFSAVLAHPWHGLLVYHPLYAVGFAAMLTCLLRSSARRERVLWAAGLGAVLINLWVQAAWHIWWLGTGTFGMRGMAAASVVLVPAIVRVIADLQAKQTTDAATRARAWALAVVAACLWSLPLLMLGTTQFFTWAAVFAAQQRGFALLTGARWLGATAVAAALIAAAGSWAQKRRRLVATDPVIIATAGFLCALSLGYVMASARGPLEDTRGAALVFPALLLVILTGSSFVLWRLATRRLREYGAQRNGDALPRPDDIARPLVAFAVTVVFIIGTALFTRLAINTERRLASGDIPQVNYQYRATFQLQIAINGLREYERISGFEERKDALRRFLESQGATLNR